MNDEILRENGRAHTTREVFRVQPWIAAQGFAEVNVDLIAGMVGETWETWRETVERTVDLDPDSITVYQMELPFNTVYSQSIAGGGRKEMILADWRTKREWHAFAFDRFERAGYERSSAYTVVRKGDGAVVRLPRRPLARQRHDRRRGRLLLPHGGRPLPERLLLGGVPRGPLPRTGCRWRVPSPPTPASA